MSGFSELSGTARTERTSVAGSADVAGQLLGLTVIINAGSEMSPNHGSRALIVSARFGKRKKCIQIVLIDVRLDCSF